MLVGNVIKCFVMLVFLVCEVVYVFCDIYCVNVLCICIWRLFFLIGLRLFFKIVLFSVVKYVKKCDDMCVVLFEY